MSSPRAFDPHQHPSFVFLGTGSSTLPSLPVRSSHDELLSHFMSLTATDDAVSGELRSCCRIFQTPSLLLSNTAAARAVLEAAGGDLALAFDLQSWRAQSFHRPEQRQSAPRPSLASPASSRPHSFADAVRRSHPLPNQLCAGIANSKSPSASAVPVSAFAHDVRHHHVVDDRCIARPANVGGGGGGVSGRGGGAPSCAANAGCHRSSAQPGTSVAIVEKHNQRSGAVTLGVVARVLTGSTMHPRGIKVQLTCGAVGRVCALR